MIIGNGLIASAFNSRDNPDVIIFASGVSNSREDRSEAFLRERELLVDALALGKFICYFSTCSVNDPELQDTPYVVHKKGMEVLVKKKPNSAIFRLPQVVGKTENPNTLSNYLYNQIKSGCPFQVWRHAKRNLIDVDDVVSITTRMIQEQITQGMITNIACPFSVSILQLVSVFEQLLGGKKANYELIEAGGSYIIDTSISGKVAKQIGVNFDENYIEKLIWKYYGK